MQQQQQQPPQPQQQQQQNPSQQPPPPLSTNGVVETLMESFCQCFGTEPSSHLYSSSSTNQQREVDDDDVIAAPSTPPRKNGNDTTGTAPSTPTQRKLQPKRIPISTASTTATNHLFTLQQRSKAQWNSFFFGQQQSSAPTTPLVTTASGYDGNNNNSNNNIVTPHPPQPEFTSSTVTAPSRRNRSKSRNANSGSSNNNVMVRKSRCSSSNSKSPSPKSQNRKGMTKRKRTSSRDDIFRSKHQLQYVRQNSASQLCNSNNNPNPNSSKNNNNTTPGRMSPFLSRFLSGSSPVCMATLCFATPIRGDSSFEDNELNNSTIGDDDNDDDTDAASTSNNNHNKSNPNGKNIHHHNDVASVVSDSNTLNTAEDTITSTLYYETTKLAGLKQTNPLMPLYNSHAVGDAKDDIHQIVHLRTKQQQQLQDQNSNLLSDRLQQPIIQLSNKVNLPRQQYVPSIPPPHQVLQENNMDDDEDDDDDDIEGDIGMEQQQHEHITIAYDSRHSTTKNQPPPVTPTKKPQHYSPTLRSIVIKGVSGGRNRSLISSSNGSAVVSLSTPNQSPLPPVSKLSSDSSKS